MFTPGEGKSEVGHFWDIYARCYGAMMRGKLGLLQRDEGDDDDALIQALLGVRAGTA
jgi:hypothetical protein